jgi:glutathione synthase/RimK-type ligase-like ATP-grasp enzyme
MLFCGVHEGLYEGVQKRIDLLRTVCESRALEFVVLDANTTDHTNLPVLTRNDILYQVSSGAQTLTSLLLNSEVTTVYITNPALNLITSTVQWSLLHDKARISSPKTIFHFTNDRTLLRRYVEYVGGFPIIIKRVGGSRGIGTIKVDGWNGLLSLADYLSSTVDRFIIREFIQAEFGARAIVLGDQVIKMSKFLFQENDFRNAAVLSNVRYDTLSAQHRTESVPLCVRALEVANLEFGGVDLLFDAEGHPYLLEVNYPTGFQSFLDDPLPILSQLIDYLINKVRR